MGSGTFSHSSGPCPQRAGYSPVIVKPGGVARDDDVVGLLCHVVFTRVHGPALIAFAGVVIFLRKRSRRGESWRQSAAHGSCPTPESEAVCPHVRDEENQPQGKQAPRARRRFCCLYRREPIIPGGASQQGYPTPIAERRFRGRNAAPAHTSLKSRGLTCPGLHLAWTGSHTYVIGSQVTGKEQTPGQE